MDQSSSQKKKEQGKEIINKLNNTKNGKGSQKTLFAHLFENINAWYEVRELITFLEALFIYCVLLDEMEQGQVKLSLCSTNQHAISVCVCGRMYFVLGINWR
jgi:hypothetical protein